jgi:hypothetical protein
MFATAGNPSANGLGCQFRLASNADQLLWQSAYEESSGAAIAVTTVSIEPAGHPVPKRPLVARVSRLLEPGSAWCHTLHLPTPALWGTRATVAPTRQAGFMTHDYFDITPSGGVPFVVLSGQDLLEMLLLIPLSWQTFNQRLSTCV